MYNNAIIKEYTKYFPDNFINMFDLEIYGTEYNTSFSTLQSMLNFMKAEINAIKDTNISGGVTE